MMTNNNIKTNRTHRAMMTSPVSIIMKTKNPLLFHSKAINFRIKITKIKREKKK